MPKTLSAALAKVGGASPPECQLCGKSGAGVLFSIFSPHGFGTYCKPCEDEVEHLDEGDFVSYVEHLDEGEK
mgnify:CR=1 FL=1